MLTMVDNINAREWRSFRDSAQGQAGPLCSSHGFAAPFSTIWNVIWLALWSHPPQKAGVAAENARANAGCLSQESEHVNMGYS